MARKTQFQFTRKIRDVLNTLSGEAMIVLYDCIFDYVFDGKEPTATDFYNSKELETIWIHSLKPEIDAGISQDEVYHECIKDMITGLIQDNEELRNSVQGGNDGE